MEDEISLREILGVVYKGKRTVAIITIIFLVGVIALNYYLRPVYQATAFLYVKPPIFTIKSSPDEEIIVDNLLGLPRINTDNIVIQAKSPTVLEKTLEKLKIDSTAKTVAEISSQIAVSRQTGKNIIQITATDSTPYSAAQLANGLSESLIDYVNKEYDKDVSQLMGYMEEQIRKGKEEVNELKRNHQQSPDPILLENEIEINNALTKLNVYNEKYALIEIYQAINNSSDNISLISPAVVPAKPISPNKALNITVGIIAGVLLGALVVITRYYIEQIKQK